MDICEVMHVPQGSFLYKEYCDWFFGVKAQKVQELRTKFDEKKYFWFPDNNLSISL